MGGVCGGVGEEESWKVAAGMGWAGPLLLCPLPGVRYHRWGGNGAGSSAVPRGVFRSCFQRVGNRDAPTADWLVASEGRSVGGVWCTCGAGPALPGAGFGDQGMRGMLECVAAQTSEPLREWMHNGKSVNFQRKEVSRFYEPLQDQRPLHQIKSK